MEEYYAIGLDLGQAADFTALAVLECPPPGTAEGHYALRHLQRFPLGTPYTAIVPAVAAMTQADALQNAPVVADQTGVGRAVVDMLQQSVAWVVPVTITGGHAVTRADYGSYHVPKKELVTALQVVMQARRLHIARGLPDARILVRELENFRVKITASAHETFEAWREGDHDDLVLAVALACWWAERVGHIGPDAFGSGGGSLIADAPPGVFLDGPDEDGLYDGGPPGGW
jgi:hypothetical protein